MKSNGVPIPILIRIINIGGHCRAARRLKIPLVQIEFGLSENILILHSIMFGYTKSLDVYMTRTSETVFMNSGWNGIKECRFQFETCIRDCLF